MVSLKNISTSEQATAILRCWWSRPKKIAELKEKYPAQLDRIIRLQRIAAERKYDALQIDAYFRMDKNPVSVNLTLGA